MQQLEKEFHIQCVPGDIGKYCILTGDPGRVKVIADYLSNAKLISHNREYVIYTGVLNNEKVSVCSTGIGGPSASIAIEELIHCGANTFIRVGTCGGINCKVCAGDLVIAMSSIRQEGTTYEYAPATYPATADFETILAITDAARELNAVYHVGVVQSKDSFYGQHSPESMPIAPILLQNWEAYKALGVLASEMESAALYVVSAARGVRCGALFTTIWNQEREKAGLDQNMDLDNTLAIRTAILAIKKLIIKDKKPSE